MLGELDVVPDDDSGSRSPSSKELLLFRLLLAAWLLLLLLLLVVLAARFVMISNSSRSDTGEVIAPTGDGRLGGTAPPNAAPRSPMLPLAELLLNGAHGSSLAAEELGCHGSAVAATTGTGVVRLFACHGSAAGTVVGAVAPTPAIVVLLNQGSTFPFVAPVPLDMPAAAPPPLCSHPSTDDPDATEGDCVRGCHASSPTPAPSRGGLEVDGPGGGNAEAVLSHGSTTGGDDVLDHGSDVVGRDPPATGIPHGSIGALPDGPASGCC